MQYEGHSGPVSAISCHKASSTQVCGCVLVWHNFLLLYHCNSIVVVVVHVVADKFLANSQSNILVLGRKLLDIIFKNIFPYSSFSVFSLS